MTHPSPLTDHMRSQLRDLLLRTYFASTPKEILDGEEGHVLVHQLVEQRHGQALHQIAPWIERTAGLRGRRVVEIGSGTGSSAAGLAPSAESLHGYEIDQTSVDIANERLQILGIENARIHTVAAEQILDVIAKRHEGQVDAFLLYAVLEHMTVEERLTALSRVWSMLPPGGLIIVIETPNRLTYFDRHTSHLPFFQMLPLELAARYYRSSPRELFVRQVDEAEDRQMKITRWGTGVSYHDFEVALDRDVTDLIVADGFEDEITEIYPILLEDRLLLSFFEELPVKKHRAFTRNHLNLILRKPA